MRQFLADKVSGNLLGIWLLVPEHLRLGTWDLLCGWAGLPGAHVEPRLALQLVHEAALCLTCIREPRSLPHRGFELANGLPFLATDVAVHNLLDSHTVAEAEALQRALGQVRQARGHFCGQLLAIDPHRITSYSKRDMRLRQSHKRDDAKAKKTSQTFFLLDTETGQPVCFTIGSAPRTVTQATSGLLALGASILRPAAKRLVLADTEHYTAELIDHIDGETPFDILVPMPAHEAMINEWKTADFTPRWAGFATAKRPYRPLQSRRGPFWEFIQRSGEKEYRYHAFLCTADRDEVAALSQDYPARWRSEVFYLTSQDLGWRRGGTLNLNIRYAQMTTALLAQAALHELRQRLGEPLAGWDAAHFAKDVLQGADGDLRVSGDTIIVTYYNLPHAPQMRQHFENLPAKLSAEGVNPHIPWLYGFKLDFRFK